jgi:hypothetical protein
MNKNKVIWLGALAALPMWMGCAEQDPVLAPASQVAPKLTISEHEVAGSNELKNNIGKPRPLEPVVHPVLKFDQTLSHRGLDIDWLEIEDSRCPDGVDCIWEGQVGITIAGRQGDKDLGRFDILLHAGDEKDAQVRVGQWVIRLLGVEPYPDIEVETGRTDYSARLAVERRGKEPPGLTISKGEAGGFRPGDNKEPPGPGPKPGPGPDHTALIAALEENRALWDAQAIDHYQYNFSWVCFCIVDFVRTVSITVENGAITNVVDAETGEALAAERFADYTTIDGLFELVVEAVNDKAQRINIRFDPEHGIPESFFIDFSEFIADEERGGEVSGFAELE